MLRTQGANRKIERNEYLNSSLSRYLLSEPIVGSLFSSKDEEEEEEEEEEQKETEMVVKWMKHRIEKMNDRGCELSQNVRRRRRTNSCVVSGKLYLFNGDSYDPRLLNNINKDSTGREAFIKYTYQGFGRFNLDTSNYVAKQFRHQWIKENNPNKTIQHNPSPLCLYLGGGEYFYPPPTSITTDYEQLLVHASTDTFSDLTLSFEMATNANAPNRLVTVACHKCILASRSTYFDSTLTESSVDMIEMGLFHSKDAIQCVLKYLYTGGSFDCSAIDLLFHKNFNNLEDILRLTMRWWGPTDPLFQYVVTTYSIDEQWIRSVFKRPSGYMFIMSGAGLPLNHVPFSDLNVVQVQVDSETGEEQIIHVAKAHRCILAARCTYYNTMFRHNMIENSSGTVIDVCNSVSASEFFLQYVYADTEKRSRTPQNVQENGNKEEDHGKHEDSPEEREGETKSQHKISSCTVPGANVILGVQLTEENVLDVYVSSKEKMLKRLKEICGVTILNIYDMEDIETVFGLWCWSVDIKDEQMNEAFGWYLSLNFSVNEVEEVVNRYEIEDAKKEMLARYVRFV